MILDDEDLSKDETCQYFMAEFSRYLVKIESTITYYGNRGDSWVMNVVMDMVIMAVPCRNLQTIIRTSMSKPVVAKRGNLNLSFISTQDNQVGR